MRGMVFSAASSQPASSHVHAFPFPLLSGAQSWTRLAPCGMRGLGVGRVCHPRVDRVVRGVSFRLTFLELIGGWGNACALHSWQNVLLGNESRRLNRYQMGEATKVAVPRL